MRHASTIVVVAALLVGSTAVATAQAPARRFEDLGQLIHQHDHVRVLDADGRVTIGRVDTVSPSALVIRTPQGSREWAPDAVATVRVRRFDPLWNGMLWGLAIGGGLSLGPANACENDFGCRGGHAEFFLVFGGAGAGIGAGIDALIRGHRLVYQRSPQARLLFAPLVTPTAHGATLAVAWK